MKIVAKFGGSSLAGAEVFKKVKAIVQENKPVVVVPSAPGKSHSKDHKITDLLYMCHQLASHNLNFDEVFIHIETRYKTIVEDLALKISIDQVLTEVKTSIAGGGSRDYCASRGEYMNGLILAEYLGYNFVDSKDIIRIKNGHWDMEETKKLVDEKLANQLPAVVPGFYGSDSEGNIVTFSRGGSDITGSIVSNCLDADLYENWTDVSGFLVADPGIVKNPKPIHRVSYRELRELSYMGAMVLHEEAIFPVRLKQIPIHIRNTNHPEDEGTYIVPELGEKDKNLVTGIAGKKDFMTFTVEKTFLSEELGFFRRLASVFETNHISIAHIPSGMDNVSVIVAESAVAGKEKKIKEEISIYCEPDSIQTSYHMALIAVVGRKMISTKGVSAKIFTALARQGINVRMIIQGASELNIVIGVENEDFEEAIRSIYNAFYKEEKA